MVYTHPEHAPSRTARPLSDGNERETGLIPACPNRRRAIHGREGELHSPEEVRELLENSFNANSKERFYNPIRQSRSHVEALSDYLDLEEEAFSSHIVFSERCELKKVPPNTAEYVICRRHHLLSNTRKDLGRFDPLFDEATFAELRSKLEALSACSTAEARSGHVQEAKRVAAGEVCPRCGSALVRRNGKHGPFMGCSSYPKCRFTRDA